MRWRKTRKASTHTDSSQEQLTEQLTEMGVEHVTLKPGQNLSQEDVDAIQKSVARMEELAERTRDESQRSRHGCTE